MALGFGFYSIAVSADRATGKPREHKGREGLIANDTRLFDWANPKVLVARERVAW